MKRKKEKLREVERALNEECKHDFSEYHLYEVVCIHCRTCRPYTQEDENARVAQMERRQK